MSKASKILHKLLSGSIKNVRFNDLWTLIEALGFVLERISGSHHIFSHPDLPETIVVQPDRNKQAKAYQIRQLLKIIEKYHLTLKDKRDQP